MTSLDFRSHKVQLICTAVAASLVTATLLTSYNKLGRKKRRKLLEEDIKRSLVEHDASTSSRPPTDEEGGKFSSISMPYDEDLMREQLARNYAFFGDDAMAKIRNGRVVIVGAGGVGSWAAVMLARS